METSKHHSPPPLAKRFLHWFCKSDLLEDISGDLEEDFNDFIEEYGLEKAKRKYWIAVIRFLKPFAIKKMSVTITQFNMFNNYFKTSIRSIGRNKLFSAINIFGLAISMSVCLLMLTILSEVKSYERFHEDAADIYRITNNYSYLDSDPSLYASTSIIAGKRLKEEVPGIAAATIMRRNFNGDFEFDNQKYPLRGIYADNDFFKVFSFEVLSGNPETALIDPKSIVLTDESALKIFNRLDVIGETVMRGKDAYQVTGVIKKPPFNSGIKFQMIGSFSTIEEPQLQKGSTGWLSWTNMWMNYAYFKIQQDYSINKVQASLDKISADQNERAEHTQIELGTQSILKIMTGPSMSNEIGPTMGNEAIVILGILSFIVILSAGFNYTNLSIARSLRRAKEVGIRKVVGARRGQIFSQFTVEACIISMFSLILAYLLFLIIKPMFLSLDPSMASMLKLEITAETVLYFITFALFVGFTAGFVPSLVLSKLKAIQVLKTNTSTQLFSSINLRKVLIVTQFTLALGFIISANIAYQQFKYSMAFDKGFDGENIINIRLAEGNPEQVKAIFERIPEVSNIAMSSMVLGTGQRWGDDLKYKDPLDSATLYYSSIDQNYLPMLGHEIIAGRNFETGPISSNESEIIVNETLLKRFNIGTPRESIGQQIEVGENMLTIVGVVKDFNYVPIDQPIECFGFRQRIDDILLINLKLETSNLLETRQKLEAAWKDFDSVHPFQAQFYSEHLENSYSRYQLMFTIVSFLAFISISIASLGLLGMGVYTAETRLKEISIRKVLGASESSLVKLLSKGFIWLLLIASLIAIPATYFLFDSVILSDQVNRAEIGVLELSLGVIVIFIIGFTTIGSQTWKAAKSNPAQTLRSE